MIQREIGVDVDTFEEGLRDAFYMNPHIIFMGYREMIPAKETEYLLRLAENALILLNTPALDKVSTEFFKPFIKAWVYVNGNTDGTLSLSFKDTEPQAQENR